MLVAPSRCGKVRHLTTPHWHTLPTHPTPPPPSLHANTYKDALTDPHRPSPPALTQTPLSIYIAQESGLRVANVPLVGAPPPLRRGAAEPHSPYADSRWAP